MIPEVVILDDSEDIRLLMKILLRSRAGIESLVLENYSEMIEQKDIVLATRLALLDINLGEDKKNGLDACKWLQENNYSGAIYFFTGHAGNHPLVIQAKSCGLQILEKPLVGSQLVNIIKNAGVRANPDV